MIKAELSAAAATAALPFVGLGSRGDHVNLKGVLERPMCD